MEKLLLKGFIDERFIKIHTQGALGDSYEDAIKLCYVTGVTVRFKFNGTDYEVTYSDLKNPSNEIAAILYKLNIRP